jgi:hypothetical protein
MSGGNRVVADNTSFKIPNLAGPKSRTASDTLPTTVPFPSSNSGRLWFNDGSCIRLRPQHCNHVWSYDFVEAQTTMVESSGS